MGEIVNLLNMAGGAFVTWAGHMLIQSSVLIAVLAALDWVLRKRVQAVVRYGIWLLVLAKLILPPSFSSPTSLAYWVGGKLPPPARVAPATPVARTPLVSLPATGESIVLSSPRAPDADLPAGRVSEEPLLPRAEHLAPASPTVSSDARITWQALALLAWATVVMVMAGLLIQRALFVRGLVAQSREAPQAIVELLHECRRRLGVQTNLAVRLSPLAASPSVCGLWRPIILIPEEMRVQLQGHELRSVLLHELAHVKRGDLWVNLIQALLQVVYFYHPLLWAANARIRKVREQAVDETVLAALGEEAEDYPRTLLSVSRLAFGQPMLSLRLLGVVESRQALMDRIRHMVSRPFPRRAKLGLGGLAFVLAVGAALLPMAQARSAASAREFVHDFIVDREIPVGLVAGTPGHPRLVEITSIRIEAKYGNAWAATAQVGWSPAVEATWQIKLELLDDQGHLLRHRHDWPTVFTRQASAGGGSAMQHAELVLMPMHWDTRRHPAQFRLSLEPAQDATTDDAAGHTLILTALDGQDRKPIAGATVLTKAYYDAVPVACVSLGSTDARGECRITLAKTGLIRVGVAVQKDGYVAMESTWSNPSTWAVANVPLLELPPRHVVEMVPAQTIGGIVRDPQGRPIAGVQVMISAHLQEAGGMAALDRHVRTDQEGRWSIGGVAGGIDRLQLGFRHPEYAGDYFATRLIQGDQLSAVRAGAHVAVLTKGLMVQGAVFDERGRPVPRAAVILAPRRSGQFHYEYADAVTDTAGRFRFDCALDDQADEMNNDGATEIIVEAPGYAPVMQRVVAARNLAPLEFRLQPGRALTLRVVGPDDRPIAGVAAVWDPLAEDGRYSHWLADTDEQGRVRIVNAPETEVHLQLLKSGYVAVRDLRLAAAPQEHVVQMKPAPRVQGTVVDAQTGAPIPNFDVGIMDRGRNLGSASHFQDGTFELQFDEARPTPVQLKISALGYVSTTSESLHLEGTRVLEFKLPRDRSFGANAAQRGRARLPDEEPGVIRGVVQDPNGRPVANAIVSPFPPASAWHTTTDAEGRFKLRYETGQMGIGIGDEGISFLIVRDQVHNLAATVEADEDVPQELLVKLRRGVVLSGRVTDAQNQGLSSAGVLLYLDMGSTGYALSEEVKPDPNGWYEIRAVPPEHRYHVNVTAEGYGQDFVEVRMAETANNRVKLDSVALLVANLDIRGVVVDAEDRPVPRANVYCYGRGQPHREVRTDAQGRFVVQSVCAGAAEMQAHTQNPDYRYGFAHTQGGATDVKIVLRPLNVQGRSAPAQAPSLVSNAATVLPMVSAAPERAKTDGASGTAAGAGSPADQITLSGRVTDPQGRPVTGAEVTLYQMTAGELGVLPKVEPIDRKTTGADGMFLFAAAKGTGAYREGRAIARKQGLSLGWAQWTMMADQRQDIRLGQPAELAGNVVDEAGRPVAEAEVHIAMAKIGKGEDLRELRSTGFLRTTTDRSGHFVFADMPAGATFEFRVEGPGRATIHTLDMSSYSREQCQFAPGQAGIRLILRVEARIEGVVVEKAGGKPVGGIEVAAHADRRRGGASLPSQRAVTGPDGTFRIGRLAAGSCLVELVTARGQMPEWVAEDVQTSLKAGETKSGLRMQLTKGAILEVLVKDTASKPVEKVSTYLRRVGQEQGFGDRTDANGLSRIRVLPGAYSVSQIFRPGYVPPETMEQVTVAEGETKRVQYTVTPARRVAGIVRDEAGNPLAGVKIQATWIKMLAAITGGAVSDASGKFDFPWDTSLPGRAVTAVIFVARDSARNLVQALDIDEDTGPLDLKLRPGVIVTGTVLNQEGKPLPGATARVLVRVARIPVRLSWDELATAGPEGVFEFKAVPPEREYEVEVTADGYGKQRISIASLGPQEKRHDIGQVKLAASNLSVSGIVVDPNDEPVAGVEVSAYGEGQPDLRSVRTDAQGRFTIKGVCPGSIRLMVNPRGPSRLYGSTQAEAGATEVRIAVAERRLPQAYAPRRGAVLKGKPLPPLRDLGIALPAEGEGKILLVCFWDMGQRPSRSCLTQLAAQATALRQKGVEIVTVHAAPVESGILRQWLEENKVPFQAGVIAGDINKTKSAWGVVSLPHLILTDKKHVVIAEGFGLNELDKQVEAMTGQ